MSRFAIYEVWVQPHRNSLSNPSLPRRGGQSLSPNCARPPRPPFYQNTGAQRQNSVPPAWWSITLPQLCPTTAPPFLSKHWCSAAKLSAPGVVVNHSPPIVPDHRATHFHENVVFWARTIAALIIIFRFLGSNYGFRYTTDIM